MIFRISEAQNAWGAEAHENRRPGPAPALETNDEVGKCTTDFKPSPLQEHERKRETKSQQKSNQSLDKMQRRPRFKESEEESTKDENFYPTKKMAKQAKKRSSSLAPNHRRQNSTSVKPSPTSIIPATSEKQ